MSGDEHGDLTDLARQVALLVAWGGSNRDVAEALGLDPNAVERHLAGAYRKLGIRSGAEPPRGSGRARLGCEQIVERREQ